MRIPVNLNNRKRKELVEALSEIVGEPYAYKGVPTYAYEIGDKVTVERDGSLTVHEAYGFGEEKLQHLVDGLAKHEFQTELIKPNSEASASEPTLASHPEIPPEPLQEPDSLIIQLPLNGFDPQKLDNLLRLIDSKASLIRKSMGITELTVRSDEKTVQFPWFDRMPTPGEIAAYSNFISLLAERAKRQVRVTAVEKPAEDEKQAFRHFLLRLGMIGPEYAETRRILLSNLSSGTAKNVNTQRFQAAINASEPEQNPNPSFAAEKRRSSLKNKLTHLKAFIFG